ncbi:very short patch repair endonuclease [Candidatus Pacearchaeota archaeon]|nr:very short patch repair endonuclease [Candidatus Pacearchaeota archaeon]
MPDTFSKKKRSQIMSKIKGRNTSLELNFKKLIRGLKLEYQPKIFGNPDFTSKKLKIAIFIDSCFWHKCPKHFRKPTANSIYWTQKINRNVERAKEVNNYLKKQDWKVVRLWEHDIKNNTKKALTKIQKIIQKRNNFVLLKTPSPL